MTLVDNLNVRRYHEMRIKEHGEDSTQALGWKNLHSQQARFAMLEDIGDMNDHSVLDVGCGHGDLRAYLDDKYPRMRYAGIDQMESFLDIAIDRYAHLPETAFYQGDCYSSELPSMDYVLACGSLSYHNNDPNYIEFMISKLFNTCHVALGFNLLSKIEPGGILTAYDPEIIIQYCYTLTDNVILHQGYFENDFTVWMYK
jgi:trans-aconitate methyltransferase